MHQCITNVMHCSEGDRPGPNGSVVVRKGRERGFTFEPKALPEANGHYQAHLTVDSGNGVGRTLRFFTFTPLFQSADRAIAYAKQQAHEWMKQKALA